MEKQYLFGSIGGGFMATAIFSGAIAANVFAKEDLLVSDISQSTREKLNAMGIATTASNAEVAQKCKYVLLAVKPQNFAAAVQGLYGRMENVISIMAGVRKERIYALLGDCKVARAMPNLPCSVGVGMIGVDSTDFRSEEDLALIRSLFSSIGEAVYLPEEKLDAVTGISGSGPAYVYLFIQSLVAAGVKQGLTEEQARQLAVQTVLGGAQMVKAHPEKSLEELISAVCSKGGTTIQAINSFRNEDFAGIVDRAVEACVKRSKELSDS